VVSRRYFAIGLDFEIYFRHFLSILYDSVKINNKFKWLYEKAVAPQALHFGAIN